MLHCKDSVILWQFQICFLNFQCSIFSLLCPERLNTENLGGGLRAVLVYLAF